jgi:hypothetical protein
MSDCQSQKAMKHNVNMKHTLVDRVQENMTKHDATTAHFKIQNRMRHKTKKLNNIETHKDNMFKIKLTGIHKLLSRHSSALVISAV